MAGEDEMNILLAFLFGIGLTALVSLLYAIWQHRESEQKLYSIIHGSPIPTFVIRKDHKVIYWNSALEKLSGIKAESILGTDQHWKAFYKVKRPCMADLIVDSTLETVPNWYSGKYNKSSLLENTYVATDIFPDLGERGKWLRFTAAEIKDSLGNLFGAIETLEDVTEQKQAEEELLKIKTLESLGAFATRVAQDFDSLMSGILRNIFLAKISADDEESILGKGLEMAEKAALQAKELAHGLMTFAKGGYPLHKIELISPLLKESVESALGEANVKISLSIPDDLGLVKIDTSQFRQVISNIIVNALEARPDGGSIQVSAQSVSIGEKEIGSLKKGKYLKITINDTGIGIKKEHLPRIFEPYFTTKTSNGKTGLGLGLAVCYSVIRSHNGYITVESEPGRGSEFSIYLPSYPEISEA